MDADEAALVFDALAAVNGDTWARVYERSGPQLASGGDTGDVPVSEKGLEFATDFTNGSFSGTVDGPGSWTGTVTVDGTYTMLSESSDEASEIWDMTIAWDRVRWADLRLDGTFTWALRADVSTDGSFTYLAHVQGDMTSHGGVIGTGALDYYTTAVLGGGRYQVFVEGTVGGHDISTGWDATDAFGL